MINIENYEGYLFLYQEGELDSTTCAEVERFLLEHPDIREEMEAYYDPTLVVTAEPPARHKRRTLPLWRWAAAACVVLALGYGTYLTISQPTENSTLVADASPVIPTTRNTPQSETPTHVTMQPPYVTQPTKILTRGKVTSHAVATEDSIPTVSPHPALNDNTMEYMAPVEATPFNEPNVVVSTQLAQINETIIVNDLAREIPGIKNKRTPPVYNLAMKIKQNIDNQRQNFFCFVQSIFISDQRSYEIAEAN